MSASEYYEQGPRLRQKHRYCAEAIADNIRNLIRLRQDDRMRAHEVAWLKGLLELVEKGPAVIYAYPETEYSEYYGYERPGPRKLDLSTGGV